MDKAPFVQTRCEGIYGWRQEETFHPLHETDEFHPDGYYANVEISMLSDYGDLHVILSETNYKTGPNPSYEIGTWIVYEWCDCCVENVLLFTQATTNN